MHVEQRPNLDMTVTMTAEQLLVVRYALSVGAEKMRQHAALNKRMGPRGCSKADTASARQAHKTVEALEKAVSKWVHRPRSKSRGRSLVTQTAKPNSEKEK